MGCRDSIWSCSLQKPAACGCSGTLGAMRALAATQCSPTSRRSLHMLGLQWHKGFLTYALSMCKAYATIKTLRGLACFWLITLPAR